MKTMTRPAAETDRSAAGHDLLPPAGRSRALHRSGRSSQVLGSRWGLLAVAAAAATALAAPDLVPWLLLPIGPAALLRAAGRDGGPPCAARVMRVFSVATLAAVLVQLASAGPAAAPATVALGGTALFLAAVERLATGEHRPPRGARFCPPRIAPSVGPPLPGERGQG